MERLVRWILWLPWLLPLLFEKEKEGEDVAKRAQMLVLMSYLGALGHAAAAVYCLAFSEVPYQAGAFAISLLLVLLAPRLLSSTGNVAIAGNYLALVLFICIGAVAGLDRGPESPVLAGHALVCQSVALLVGPFTAALWMVAGVGQIWFFHFFQLWGISFPRSLYVDHLGGQAVLVYSALTVAATLFGLLYCNLKEQVLQETRHIIVQRNMARQAAEHASASKSEFLTCFSHELRTPLNGILGCSELLLEGELDSEQRDFAETVHSSARALLVLVNAILDLRRIEVGALQLNIVPFDVCPAVEEVLSLMDGAARAKGVELLLRCRRCVPKCILGDLDRLRQVIINLVGNSIKFTNQGHVLVDIEAKCTSNTSGLGALEVEEDNPEHDRVAGACKLRVSITDTGIGIPEGRIGSMFEKFTQLDSSAARKYGGSGLGLSICRQLLHLMNGEINARSEPGKGSTFFFDVELPYCDPSIEVQKPTNEEQEQAETLKNLTVLVCEDRPVHQAVLGELLDQCGVNWQGFTTLEDAIAGATASYKIHSQATFLHPCETPPSSPPSESVLSNLGEKIGELVEKGVASLQAELQTKSEETSDSEEDEARIGSLGELDERWNKKQIDWGENSALATGGGLLVLVDRGACGARGGELICTLQDHPELCMLSTVMLAWAKDTGLDPSHHKQLAGIVRKPVRKAQLRRALLAVCEGHRFESQTSEEGTPSTLTSPLTPHSGAEGSPLTLLLTGSDFGYSQTSVGSANQTVLAAADWAEMVPPRGKGGLEKLRERLRVDVGTPAGETEQERRPRQKRGVQAALAKRPPRGREFEKDSPAELQIESNHRSNLPSLERVASMMIEEQNLEHKRDLSREIPSQDTYSRLGSWASFAELQDLAKKDKIMKRDSMRYHWDDEREGSRRSSGASTGVNDSSRRSSGAISESDGDEFMLLSRGHMPRVDEAVSYRSSGTLTGEEREEQRSEGGPPSFRTLASSNHELSGNLELPSPSPAQPASCGSFKGLTYLSPPEYTPESTPNLKGSPFEDSTSYGALQWLQASSTRMRISPEEDSCPEKGTPESAGERNEKQEQAALKLLSDGQVRHLRPSSAENKKRILVSDDVLVNQKVASIMVKRAGYNCDVACDGAQSVAMHSHSPYDLILMDCQMPVMDGFKATANIRMREAKSGIHTPIVALTASSRPEDKEKCLESGMDDFISKPLDTRTLHRILHKYAGLPS